MKLVVVMPAHNEALTLGKLIREIKKIGLGGIEKEIVVVDDGSTDATASIARQEGAIVASHPSCRGLGASLRTGIAQALQRGAEWIVTFDADGQHAAEDIPRVLKPLLDGKADAVLGNRLLQRGSMPPLRRLANRIANFFTRRAGGIACGDSQSGFRAFTREAAQKMDLKSLRYEVSSEICREIRRLNLKWAEVPIQNIYTSYSLSKGQGFFEGLCTLFRLFRLRGGGEGRPET